MSTSEKELAVRNLFISRYPHSDWAMTRDLSGELKHPLPHSIGSEADLSYVPENVSVNKNGCIEFHCIDTRVKELQTSLEIAAVHYVSHYFGTNVTFLDVSGKAYYTSHERMSQSSKDRLCHVHTWRTTVSSAPRRPLTKKFPLA
jgi:hypothetical protein